LEREFHQGWLDADISRTCNIKNDRSWRKVVVNATMMVIGIR